MPATVSQSVESLSVLSALATALARASRSVEFYDAALDAVAKVSGTGRSSFLLFDPDGVMRFKACRGLSAEYRRAVEGHTPWRPHQTDASPLLVGDVTTDPTLHNFLETILGEGIRSMGMFPLMTGGGVIGKFMVYYDRPRAFEVALVETMGTIAAITAFALDRQRAVDTLEAEQSMFVAGPTVVFKWRNEPGFPVDYASPNVTSMLGYDPDRLVGMAFTDLVHVDDRERVCREIDAAREHQRASLQQAYRLLHSDGTYREVNDFQVFSRSHEFLQGYVLDVTEENAAKAALAAAEGRLREVQRLESLGVLAGGIAHDFNNLLLAVLGNAGLAASELDDHSPARPFIREIESAAHRAADLTKKLLAFSGKGKFVVEPVNLSRLVEDGVRGAQAAAPTTLTWVLDLAVGLPLIEADVAQLRQVLNHLLANGAEAVTGGTGKVTVRTRSVEVDAADTELAAGTHVVLDVTDDGVGMSSEIVHRVFDPFFTTKFHGRGLGLAAVSGIVKGHRGVVRIESAEGTGTTVRVFFPAARAPRTPIDSSREQTPASSRSGQRTILVVDDEPMIRNVAARALKRSGFVVLEAAHGRAALEVLESEAANIDLVLLDLTMPVMGGEEALGHIRQSWPDLPVILSSGFNAESSSSLLKLSNVSFLQKPYAHEALLELVRSYLSSATRDVSGSRS
jgi:PAS domain S-box-containing protein